MILSYTELHGGSRYAITDREALRLEVDKIRSQGYAIDDREHEGTSAASVLRFGTHMARFLH
ncbi:IclR family transcriptional regulator domain-containing protein [Olavius algarvensis spirochete endosymbiont]|uniref:IclR family transcriptional regulator domain-containing protein n=1 Tax=Olavius algarvensis spirochete endosymbiont TaxID=260710 RepID=UPI000F51A4EB